MIPATDFPVAGLPAMGSSVFSNAASLDLIAHVLVFSEGVFSLCHSAVRWPLVSSVPKLAYATVKNTVRNSIDRLVWEPCHSY